MAKPRAKIAIAGMGSRGMHAYAKIIKESDMADITAVADPNPERINAAGEMLGIAPAGRFETLEDLIKAPRMADALIIATQDKFHCAHAMAAMEAGYDILLEKPIAVSLSEVDKIAKTAERLNRRVAVCHVLRYAPFYQTAKRVILNGRIGVPVNITAMENVAYWHQAHSFVRGNWSNTETAAFMLLAKCCHDLDIISWLMDRPAVSASSYGALSLFRKENAPQGSAFRCLDGCRVKKDCAFDCEEFYLNSGYGLKNNTEWPVNTLTETLTEESVLEALRTGPYGRCVYHCGNDVVDHQVVNILFSGGATASLTMSGLTYRAGRELTVMGTGGEIYGSLEDNRLTVAPFGKKPEIVDVKTSDGPFSGHGGGDAKLISDFIQYISGLPYDSISMTSLKNSLQSHYIAFAAEKSRLNGTVESTKR